jgi:DNA modification methylase
MSQSTRALGHDWSVKGAMAVSILTGHVLGRLRGLPVESVHCVVTSPPYFGLRSYGMEPHVWGGDPNCEQVRRREAGAGQDGQNRHIGAISWW